MVEPPLARNESFFIDLDGLRLKQVDEKYLGTRKPFKHQVESERLIKSNKSFFLFNHSPTGSGKTISWLKPALDEKMKVIAVYPTNALVIDQEEQVKKTINDFNYNPEDYHIQAITSDLLVKEKKLYPDENGLNKGQLLNRVIRKGRGRGLILLTNPDILTLVLKDAYYDHNIRESVRSVDMIVVDEFHLASVKQSDMLLFMMHEINDDKRSKLSKFAFLSATPNHEIVKRAKMVGLNVIVLEDESEPLSLYPSGHPVLPKLRLEIRKGSIYRTYERIKEDLNYFVELCKKPGPSKMKAKTVFILDGIYEVEEIFNTLSESMADDFRIERVDGLHRATPEKLKNFDVLVSNSSVEVGIDFKVDRLVFSGYSKSQLLQRIGRLRNKHSEDVCESVCFVPEVVYDHLKGQSKVMTREMLVQHIEKVMASKLDLSSYSKRYSPFEAYLYLISRIKGYVWRDSLGDEHHTKGMPEEIQMEEFERMLKLIRKHFLDCEIDRPILDNLEEESEKLKDGLLSYRGNRLQALIFDEVEDELKLYDLTYLLRRGDVEFMSSREFASRLREKFNSNYEINIKPQYESKKRFAAGFCWYNGTIEDRVRTVKIYGDYPNQNMLMIEAPEHARKPRKVNGFKVETDPDIPSLSRLNQTLIDYDIFARLIDHDSYYLKAKFNLGDLFYLYSYKSGMSIAFGHEALYIDCILKEDYERRRRIC